MKKVNKKNFNYQSRYRELRKKVNDLDEKFNELCLRIERAESLSESARFAKEVAIFHKHDKDGRVILP